MIILTLILKFFLGLMFLLYKIVFAVFAGAVCLIMGIIAKAIDGKSTASYSGNVKRRTVEGKKPLFTNEEILATGLYPKDEGYKMSLISWILDK